MKADVIIIGAGPAGLAAASTAAEHGLETLVLDEQPSLGGQIYRNIERASKDRVNILGKDYSQGRLLIQRFRKSHAGYQGNTLVWRIDPDGRICFSHDGQARQIEGKKIILATGAMERPVPFPGWNLPGVMGVGALDANLKSSGTIPDGPVVMAGSGPLILSSAVHLIRQGVEIAGILDTTPADNILAGLAHMVPALKRPGYLFKGLAMIGALKRARVRIIRGVTSYKALGDDQLDRVAYLGAKGKGELAARILLVHEGIIPRTDFTRQLGLDHAWNPVQKYWHPVINLSGKTQMDKIYVAGDGAFVHGSISAALKGELAALDIAWELKAVPDRQKGAALKRIRKQLAAELSPRPFVDAIFKPRSGLYDLDDNTLVCRCEGISAGDIREALDQGCRDPNEIKALTRCGMGPCQGRMCGPALCELIAHHLGTDVSQLPVLNIRPPVRNISLAELADIDLLEPQA